MNSTGLSIIKTLGCMTAVTFFTIYNTWDRFDYDYQIGRASCRERV